MDNHFELTVTHNDKQITFNCQLLNYGYSYKIEVDIMESKILFEPDEERNWRALISYEEIERNKKISKELLSIIASAIDDILK